MKIRMEHQYLGAALMQVAEHRSFTAINPLVIGNNTINNAFLINSDTCLFLKYGQNPKQGTGEYQFTFTAEHQAAITHAAQVKPKIFIGLVCVEDQEVCCLDLNQYGSLLNARFLSHGSIEDSYQVLVTAAAGKSLRAYTNASGKRGVIAGDELVISRSRFPGCLFG